MMADKKRKSKDGMAQSGKKDREFRNNKRKNLSYNKKNKKEDASEKERRHGPRLPNALRKELDVFNRIVDGEPSDVDEGIDSDDAVGNDVYEYEEGIAEEESKKNRRFDTVENYQYELPEDFKDSDVASDEGEDDEDEDNNRYDNENGNEGRHTRMLEGITGLPSDAFAGVSYLAILPVVSLLTAIFLGELTECASKIPGRKKKDIIITEAYPESEYNPSSDILDGDGRISIQDLLDPLHGKSGFSKLRKNLQRMNKKSVPTLAPLPKPEQERLERKAAYEHSKKDITKWEPLVKRNREAPTLYFDEDVDLGVSTIGAIASEFEPRTDFEKKIASLV
ncbi:UNVERIFIED_CONTAM: U3 small nucleolar RNA-associated protein 14A [Sesamum radiatum]|uniref:U3 small nucleolar RNA-associated protein 14A n=1 Tax=Sesamum radiatum TaxID=300843 RepID=A0AAW2M784_SESRA